MAESMVTLPECLSRLTIPSKTEVQYLVKKAKTKYRFSSLLLFLFVVLCFIIHSSLVGLFVLCLCSAQSSNSFRLLLRSVATRKIAVDSQEYQNLLTMSCLNVSADELIRFVFALFNFKVFVSDCLFCFCVCCCC